MEMMWLKIDTELSYSTTRLTPRAPDGCVDDCVKYPDAHVEDYSVPDGTVVVVPQCSSSYAKLPWHDLQFFPGNVKNNWNRCRKVRLSAGTAKSDALQGCQGIPGDNQKSRND